MENKKRISKITATVFIWIFVILCIVPFIWMLSASVKSEAEVFAIPFQLIPDELRLDNYTEVLSGKYDYLLMYWNSIKVTLMSVVLSLLTTCLAGYGFAKLKFPGRDKIFLIYLATMMIPPQLLMVPKFLMFKEMGIYDTHWALILPAAFSIYGVFMMRQYIIMVS